MAWQNSAVQLQYMGRVVAFIAGTAKIMLTSKALVAYTVNRCIVGGAGYPGAALSEVDELLQIYWSSVGVCTH